MNLTHLSLFSGIGGLDLAAEWAGFETVGQCEWADYPTKVLGKHWPDAPRWRDIRELTKESFYDRTGLQTVDVISGGFPCQPFSVAGKQKGKADNRYLWPQMLRVIRELTPRWVVGENVPGILRIAAADVVQDLERAGYNVVVLDFEAAAVGAPHRRERIAFVANRRPLGNSEYDGLSTAEIARGAKTASGNIPEGTETTFQFEGAGVSGNNEDVADANGNGRGGNGQESQEGRDENEINPTVTESSNVADANGEGQQGSKQCGTLNTAGEEKSYRSVGECGEIMAYANNRSGTLRRIGELSDIERERECRRDNARGTSEHVGGERRPIKPGLGGMVDGFSGWLDEPIGVPRVSQEIKDREDRLRCLGNAVVPQQFYPIFRAIAQVEMEGKR